MFRLRYPLLALALSTLTLAACTDSQSAQPQPASSEATINTSDYKLEPYQELDADGRGRLQMDMNGCVYLEGPERDTDLAWPTDYRTETTPRGLSVTNSAGARLRIGAQVSLVGTYWEADDPLTCRYTNDNTVIYVVDFLGKTTGGG